MCDMEIINGRYDICDCEHRGDVNSAVHFIEGLGCKVVEAYWDGHDCGEAYIRFCFKSDRFVSVYNKLSGSGVSFDKDINDYLPIKAIDGIKRVSSKEYSSLYEKMKYDISEGFEKRIPINLFFHEKSRNNLDVKDFLNQIISIIGEGTEVLCYKNEVVDGNEYHNFLLTTDISNMVKDRFSLIGDYHLGNSKYSLMRRNNLYGECRCIHVMFGSYYDVFRNNVKKIMNKENLVYRTDYAPNREVGFDEYSDEDKLKYSIEYGRYGYRLKTN